VGKKLRRKKNLFFWLLLFFLALAGGGTVPAIQKGLIRTKGLLLPAEAGENTADFRVLLLGTDARPGDKNWGVGRTDSIIVADVNLKNNRLVLLSIPRDSRVDIPGHGLDKINAAIDYGGPELTAQVVSKLIGMPVSYYALVDWNGFQDIVDTVGGVTIDVQQNMYHYDSSDGPEYTIDLHKGVQHLDGRQALEFVRFRDGALGDIGRTRRQQEFLKALARQVMQPGNLIKLPVLIPEIKKCVKTNLGLREMLTLAWAARNFNRAQIVTQTLPGQFLTIDGLSYWGVDPRQARLVARRLFQSGLQTAQVVEPSPVTTPVPESNVTSLSHQVFGGQHPPAQPQAIPTVQAHNLAQDSGSDNASKSGRPLGGENVAVSESGSPIEGKSVSESAPLSGKTTETNNVLTGGNAMEKTNKILPDQVKGNTKGDQYVEITPLPEGVSAEHQ